MNSLNFGCQCADDNSTFSLSDKENESESEAEENQDESEDEDDDSDEEWNDPDKLYCICRKPYSNRWQLYQGPVSKRILRQILIISPNVITER